MREEANEGEGGERERARGIACEARENLCLSDLIVCEREGM